LTIKFVAHGIIWQNCLTDRSVAGGLFQNGQPVSDQPCVAIDRRIILRRIDRHAALAEWNPDTKSLRDVNVEYRELCVPKTLSELMT
jgi:hypothetical protein